MPDVVTVVTIVAAASQALRGRDWDAEGIEPLLELVPAIPRLQLLRTLARADLGSSPQRVQALSSLLCDPEFRPVWTSALGQLDSGPAGPAALEALVDRTRVAWSELGPMVAPVPRTLAQVLDCARADVALAQSRLRSGGDWSDSWERQRLDLGATHLELTGVWFVEGVILQCLAATGVEIVEDVARLFDAVPADRLSYFREQSFIPPDTDSLALFVDLALTCDRRDDPKLARWMAPLSGLDSTAPSPTWLAPGGRGLVPLPGDDCPAVRLALAAALLRLGDPEHGPQIRANLEAVLAIDDATALRGHYYGPEYTALLLTRCLAHASTPVSVALQPALLPALAVRKAEEVARIWATQAGDGGIGDSVLATAHAIELAADEPVPTLDLIAAARYLHARQRSDGAWPSEAFYPTFGRDGRSVGHGGPSLTTALCMRGLARLSDALANSPDRP